MKESKLNHQNPQELEKLRIEEVRNLSYTERLQRLFVLLEVSYMMKTGLNPKEK